MTLVGLTALVVIVVLCCGVGMVVALRRADDVRIIRNRRAQARKTNLPPLQVNRDRIEYKPLSPGELDVLRRYNEGK